MENSEKRAIHEYVKKRIGHNGEAFREQYAFEKVLMDYQPKIIFGTTVMVTKFADQLTEGYYKVAKLIIDEASLLTELNYLSLLLHFSKLEQIFLRGDIQQLPPYSGSLPESVKQIGHNSCLENLISRKAIISINLRYSY